MGESLVRFGDELYIYYGCWDGDHLSWNRDGTTYYNDRMRIWRTALATLRWDGFASLDAGERGTLLTRPLRLDGRGLSVNASTTGGSLRAQLEDEQGRPLAGFSFDDCEPVRGDGVDFRVRWKNDPDLRSVAVRPLRLRFELARASLFGFRVTG
jgi:hypothetical protein